MNRNHILRALSAMNGKLFKYNKENYRVIRTSFENVVKIITDKRDFTFLAEDFKPEEFEEIAEAVATLPVEQKNVYMQPKVTTQSLINSEGYNIANIIMENIAEIRKNPGFVPQAEAINNSVKTFIDLAKTEVELIKATR